MFSGLDLASRKSGWCVGAGDALPRCGAWEFVQAGNDLGRMLEMFDFALGQHIEQHRPDFIVYEAPIMVVNDRERGTDRLLTLRKLYNLGGHLEWVCRRHGIGCAEVGLKEIKKELTGNANADKELVVAAALRCGINLPSTKAEGREDAADAFGAWLLLLQAKAPHLAERFFKALWGGRGALQF